ncbi:MAG: GMC family oxidoreductase [Pyrinomonadaceae bacterium]
MPFIQKRRKVYDAIVIGTGAGGSTAIKFLCEAGLNVLALNSGKRLDPAKDYGNHRQKYEMQFRGFGDPKTRHLRQGACENEVTFDLFEHDVTYTVAPGSRWKWTRCKATGGKANFWGRSSARFGDIDFKAASLDGVGEDWPITYDEIAPYYSRIEKIIGVASSVQNRPSNPDGEYIPPFQLRCFDHILKHSCDELNIPYLHDRCAQLTINHNGHPACHYCAGCTLGCETGSFFSPTFFFLPDAERTGKLELRANAHVKNILVSADGRRASGVAYIDRTTRQEVEVYGKVVIVAASCCESAKIMLNSKSRQWPTGVANASAQLGRNLSDHLYGTPAYGFLPQLVGQPPRPDNVADSTVVWMPRWQNLKNPREEKFIRGYSVYPYGGCSDFPHYFHQFEGFGSDFKRNLKRYYPAPVSFLIQAPSLPDSGNFLDIDPEVKDVFGIPVARFHFNWGTNELLMWEHAKEVCAEIIRRAGGEVWGAETEPRTPGHSLHETGACRFGKDPKNMSPTATRSVTTSKIYTFATPAFFRL